MGEIEEPDSISTVDEEDEERTMPCNSAVLPEYIVPEPRKKAWWAWMAIYTLLVLVGQSSATLLGRLYFHGGGNSISLAAILEFIGFPILLPLAFYFVMQDLSRRDRGTNDQSSTLITAAAYIFLGLLQAAGGILFAIGLQNLQASTFSLITSTQLAFNAFFSFFLNAQKFTPPILNSVVLLTISSILLVLQTDSKNPSENTKAQHFLVGILCTLVASALNALLLSLTQLTFHKVIKRETFSTVLNMIIYQSFVASCIIIVPLFLRGEWRALRNEMENFEHGEVLYMIVVVMIAVTWQLYAIGAVGLIFEVSSLFSNVISTVGLPIVPILAAIFFHERMDGIKVISIVLAVWGFVSYVYQHYLNGCERANVADENVEFVQESSVTQEHHGHRISM